MPKRLLYIKEYEGFEEGNYSRWTKSGSGTATVGTDYKKFGTYGQTTTNNNSVQLDYKPKVFYIEDGEELVVGWFRLNMGTVSGTNPYCSSRLEFILPYTSDHLAFIGLYYDGSSSPPYDKCWQIGFKTTILNYPGASFDTWYYATLSRSGSTITISIYDENGNLQQSDSDTFTDFRVDTVRIYQTMNFAQDWNAWYDNILIEKRRILT